MKKYRSIFYGLILGLFVFTVGATFVERGTHIFRDTVTFSDFVSFAKMPKTTYGNGAGVTSVDTAVEYGDGVLHETVLTLNNTMTLTDAAGTGGVGTQKIYDFPAGAIEILASFVNLTASSASGSTHGLVAAADGDFSLGTAAALYEGALSGTEADIIASTALTQFANTAGVIKGVPSALGVHDGTTTAKDVYLNVIFDDADSGGADTLAVAGTVKLIWINLGDY